MAAELRSFGWEVQEPRYAQRSKNPLPIERHRLHGRRLSSASMSLAEIRTDLDRSVHGFDPIIDLVNAAENAVKVLMRSMSRRACTDWPEELSWERDGNHLYRVRSSDLWTPRPDVR